MFKKIFAVVAACATVATMSVSAFAAEEAAHKAGSVSVTGYAAVNGATQYTVMVFADDFAPAYTDVSKIFYINQGSNPSDLLTGMLVKGGELADGDYTVRIGNDAGKAVDVDLKVEGEVVKILYGDVDGNGVVDLDDAMQIIYKAAWEPSIFDDDFEGKLTIVANVSKDRDVSDEIDLDDAMEIIYKAAWEPSELDKLNPEEF